MQKLNVFDEFKIRASWGISGNQGISPYQTLNRYGTEKYWFADKWQTAIGPGYEAGREGANDRYILWGGIANPDLRWESTRQWNLGVDLAFFKRRLRVTMDYYDKYTTDLLREKYLPLSSSYDKMWVNDGNIRNRGFELTLDGDIVSRKNTSFSATFIFSRNRNEVTDLGNAVSSGLSTDYLTGMQYEVCGQSLSMFNGNPSVYAPTLSTACMDCSVACKAFGGGVEGYSKVGAGVGDAGIAGLSGEAVITVTEVPAVDGAVSQSDGQHGVVPILTQIRILNEGAASRQLPGGEALWVEGAILLQKVQVYILGEGAAAEEGVVHGDGEGHTVLRESHLGIGDLAVGGHEVAAVRQGREGHSEAACIDLGGADGLPAALHPHGIALPSPGPVDFRATNAGRNIGVIASVAALFIVEKAQCGQLHAWKTGDAVIDVRPASDHPDGCLGLDLAPKQGRIQPQHPTADAALAVDPVQAGAVLVRSQFHQEISLVRLDGGDKACVVPIESPNFRLRGDGGEGIRLGGIG